MNSAFSYTFGRICAVATRPLILFGANNLLLPANAQGIAVAILAVALGMVVTAANPERRFYSRLFNDTAVNGIAFYLYAASVGLLSVLGVVFVCGMTYYFSHSPALCAAAAGYFLSEKLGDEILRLQLFERRFARWGRLSSMRALLQVAGSGVAILLLRAETPDWLVVLLLMAGALVAFLPQLPRAFVVNLRPGRLRAHRMLVLRAVRSLIAHWTIWAIALLSAAVAYIDRLVALVLSREMLPLFMVVVMCFSTVQMAVDFYYVSRRRRDFLERRITLRDAFTSRDFVASVGGGLLVGTVAAVAALLLSHNGASFPVGFLLVIAILQTSTSMATVPREIVYWSHRVLWLIQVEVIFWAAFVLLVVLSALLSLPPMVIFSGVAACGVLRLGAYVAAGRKAQGIPGEVSIDD